jgi:hypothetical protein
VYQPQYYSGQTVPSRPKSGSRRALLLGAVGAAIAVIVAIVVVVVVVGGRDKEPPGPPPPPPLADSAVGTLLLTTDEANSIMGTTNLEAGTLREEMNSEPPKISDPSCSGAFSNAVLSVYEGTGYNAVSNQILSAEDPQAWLNQTAVTFFSADQATKFVDKSEEGWKACAGDTVSVTLSNETSWKFGEVARDNAQIEQLATQDSTTPWACQHVLRSVSNVVIEAIACGAEITDQARRIADQMAAKMPK